MAKFDALFEDEDDIFGGTPVSKYWDIAGQTDEFFMKEFFDELVEKIAVMESMLSEHHDYDNLDNIVRNYAIEHMSEIDTMKKSVYMDLAGKLIYSKAD